MDLNVHVQEVTGKINLITAEVLSISGTVTREGHDNGDKNAFTPGSVRYIGPEWLRPFTAARQSTLRTCRARGVRFFGGWGVPDEALPQLLDELSEVGGYIEEKKGILLNGWSEAMGEWRTAHPEIMPWQGRFPTREYAAKQIGFAVSVCKISPAMAKVKNAENGIHSEIRGLAGRVLEEIAQDVKDTWSPSQSKASQRIRNLLERIAEKARSLSFIDGGRLGALALFVEDTIAAFPSSGYIEGHDFLVLSGLMSILGSPEKMAEGVLSINMEPEPIEVYAPQLIIPEMPSPLIEMAQTTAESVFSAEGVVVVPEALEGSVTSPGNIIGDDDCAYAF
jgi:hypothetical protein